jgi:hypothetical protein
MSYLHLGLEQFLQHLSMALAHIVEIGLFIIYPVFANEFVSVPHVLIHLILHPSICYS